MNLLLKSESTTYYPAGNGQAEAMNKILLQIRKNKVNQSQIRRAIGLTKVLWAYRTSARTSTMETPYSLVYGNEAVLPVEIDF